MEKGFGIGVAIVVLTVAVFVVLGVVIGLMSSARGPPPPTSLPIPAGTVISQAGYNVTFLVSGGPARLVGSWYADHGGFVTVCSWNRNISCGFMIPHCVGYPPGNGTANVSLAPGTYSMRFSPGPPGAPNGTFVVTQTIRLVYPGDSPGATAVIWFSGCGAG